jgi:hypothetical protein
VRYGAAPATGGRASTSGATPPQRGRPWKAQPSLNQLETGTCVGHGIKHWMLSAPVVEDLDAGPSAYDFYRAFVLDDEWTQNYHGAAAPEKDLVWGTSVRARMKWLKANGYIWEYVRCYSATTVQTAVKTLTPVPVGTNWTRAMFTPTAEGIVRYNAQLIEGGYCYLCHWNDEHRRLFLCQQSWGHTWGVDHPTQKALKGLRGFFWIPGEDFEQLIKDNGEARAGVEVRRRARRVPPVVLGG